jgi:putative ABC transport system permease protein
VLRGLETLKGVQRVAPQLVFRTDASGYKGRGEVVDLIAFDPARDITVQPWLAQHLDRPLRKGDVIIGGRREEAIGSELLIFGWPLTVYGKLGQTAVGNARARFFHHLPDARRHAGHHAADLQQQGAARTRQDFRGAA